MVGDSCPDALLQLIDQANSLNVGVAASSFSLTADAIVNGFATLVGAFVGAWVAFSSSACSNSEGAHFRGNAGPSSDVFAIAAG